MLQYYEEIPQLGQKKVAGGSDGLNGKNGVGIISDTERFLRERKVLG